MRRAIWVFVCAICVDWTRLSGKVKAVNLRDSTVTIENADGGLFTIPVDYQVSIHDRQEVRDLRHLVIDEKVMLLRTLQEKPVEDSGGLVPTEKEKR